MQRKKQIHSYLQRIESNNIDWEKDNITIFILILSAGSWQSPFFEIPTLVRYFPCSLITPVCELPSESPGKGAQGHQIDWIWSLVNHMSHPPTPILSSRRYQLVQGSNQLLSPLLLSSPSFQHSWFLIDWIWLYPFEGFYVDHIFVYNQHIRTPINHLYIESYPFHF